MILPPQENIPLGPQKMNLMKTAYKKGMLDIGLHGYSHQTIRTDHFAEFEGLDYNSQLDRLTKGKQYLEEILDAPVLTFMPPWNRYDRNTFQEFSGLLDWLGNQPDVSILSLRQEAGACSFSPHLAHCGR